MNQDYFFETLFLALDEAVSERDRLVFAMRYGLTSGTTMTLQEIGDELGISRERVRQLVNRAIRRIRTRGNRDIKQGDHDTACAQLVACIRGAVQADTPGDAQRLVDFCETYLPTLKRGTHAFPLVANLACTNNIYVPELITLARGVFKERGHQAYRERHRRKSTETFQSLMPYVIWPEHIRQIPEAEYRALSPLRSVSKQSKVEGFFSEKMERRVECESRAEQDFLKMLEWVDDVCWYQEQAVSVPYIFDERERNYYPDVLLVLNDGRGIIAEYVPVFEMALKVNLTKWSALRGHCTKRGLGILVTDGRCAIQQVMKYPVNPIYTREVLKALEDGRSLTWQEYKRIKDKYDVTRDEFIALVLKNRLDWRLAPFSLQMSSDLTGG